jgi:hypothetical protein
MEIVIYFICLVIIHRLHLPITQQEGTQIFPFTDMITSCKTKDLESFEDELLPSQHETPLSDYPDTSLPTHFLTALSGFNSCSTLFCEIPPTCMRFSVFLFEHSFLHQSSIAWARMAFWVSLVHCTLRPWFLSAYT